MSGRSVQTGPGSISSGCHRRRRSPCAPTWSLGFGGLTPARWLGSIVRTPPRSASVSPQGAASIPIKFSRVRNAASWGRSRKGRTSSLMAFISEEASHSPYVKDSISVTHSNQELRGVRGWSRLDQGRMPLPPRTCFTLTTSGYRGEVETNITARASKPSYSSLSKTPWPGASQSCSPEKSSSWPEYGETCRRR